MVNGTNPRSGDLATSHAGICKLLDLLDRNRAVAEIEQIFFETSGTRQFESGRERAAFRERWLGRYLSHHPGETFVAVETGGIVGYLAGCLTDPAKSPLFADISYFTTVAHLSKQFPAHLHINVTARCRGQGIGARLIEAFARHAADAGVPGMHVVTGEGARNNRFYLAQGFERLCTTVWNGNRIAFLGRQLQNKAEQP